MKAVGIVRKIDHLGRIIIPKEIRDIHGWHNGQRMEMYVNEESVILKAYNPPNDLTGDLNNLIAKITNKAEINEEEKNLISILNYTAENIQKNKSSAPTLDSK